MELSPHSLTAPPMISGIRSLVGKSGKIHDNPSSALPPEILTERQPQSCFGENQLLPSSISLSLLPTSHPRVLHGSRVRASPHISTGFTLLMGSSPGFGSLILSKVALLTLAFASPPGHNPLDKESTKTRWLVLQKARGHPMRLRAGLPLFVSKWFQVLFHRGHPPAFHLSLTVLVHYR